MVLRATRCGTEIQSGDRQWKKRKNRDNGAARKHGTRRGRGTGNKGERSRAVFSGSPAEIESSDGGGREEGGGGSGAGPADADVDAKPCPVPQASVLQSRAHMKLHSPNLPASTVLQPVCSAARRVA